MKWYLSITFLFLFSLSSLSQTIQEQNIATEYLNNGEFDKAVGFYEKFHRYEPDNISFYKNYIVCLTQLGDLKTAEKVIRNQIKANKGSFLYTLDLGQLYRKTGEEKKAKQIFDEALRNVAALESQITELADQFLLMGETDYALATYQKGLKLLNNPNSLRLRLADLYYIKGENSLMINELMTVLSQDETQITAIQNLLTTILDDNPESDINQLVKNALLREAQKNVNNLSYTQLLIWFFIQQSNFESAFVQAKALDKRTNSQGDELMELGKICLENRQYETAARCFNYVVEKGINSYNYLAARIALLKVMNLRLKEEGPLSRTELSRLESDYLITLKDIGPSPQAASLIIELADLRAFYLGNTKSAKDLLNELLNQKQASVADLARAKMKLADILILEGDLWEPALLYGQVEKDFKNDVLGQEAKFRNARLSYFRGEFIWAEAQMEVLKASTSKLIANDALALSLLIMDNSGLDTSFDALRMFARADLLLYQRKLEQASLVFDSITRLYSYHSILDEVYFKQADIAVQQSDISLALSLYQKILEQYPNDILADDALFRMAEIYDRRMSNIAKALACYQQLFLSYPGSVYVIEARKRYRILRGDKIN